MEECGYGEPKIVVRFENVLARLSEVSEQRLPIRNVSYWACSPEMLSLPAWSPGMYSLSVTMFPTGHSLEGN